MSNSSRPSISRYWSVITAEFRHGCGFSMRCDCTNSVRGAQSSSPTNSGIRLRPSKRDVARVGDAAQVDERRQQVDVGGELLDLEASLQPRRPADEAGHAMPALVDRALRAAHAGVEHAAGAAVVGHEDEDRVVGQLPVRRASCSSLPRFSSKFAIMP